MSCQQWPPVEIKHLAIPENAQSVQVFVHVEVPIPGGGARVVKYQAQPDGTLVEYHYCDPPHERDVAPTDAATWTCRVCGTVWNLTVRSWYCSTDPDRDDFHSHDY